MASMLSASFTSAWILGGTCKSEAMTTGGNHAGARLPFKEPTPAGALAITRALRIIVWMGGGSRSVSKSFAVPISKFQSDVSRLLAAQRGPDSYIAGSRAASPSTGKARAFRATSTFSMTLPRTSKAPSGRTKPRSPPPVMRSHGRPPSVPGNARPSSKKTARGCSLNG